MDPTKLEEKLDKMAESLASIDKTTVRQQAILEEHIRRTAAAETRIEQVAESLEPIKAHVAMVNGALKLIGLVGVLVSILAGIVAVVR